MKTTTSKLLTVFEVEAMTGRKAATWRKDIAQRRIPFVRIGGSVRIPLEVVEDLIKKGWQETVSSTKD